jgi:hypothetical protein
MRKWREALWREYTGERRTFLAQKEIMDGQDFARGENTSNGGRMRRLHVDFQAATTRFTHKNSGEQGINCSLQLANKKTKFNLYLREFGTS